MTPDEEDADRRKRYLEAEDRRRYRQLDRCGARGLEGFTFRFQNYYWVVKGDVPLALAKRLYADPIGVTDIRVDGHCACPPPEPPWLMFRASDGVEVVHDPSAKQETEWDRFCSGDSYMGELLRAQPRPRFSRDAFKEPGVEAFVTTYHIDSEVGLYVFVQAVKAWRTAPHPDTPTECSILAAEREASHSDTWPERELEYGDDR